MLGYTASGDDRDCLQREKMEMVLGYTAKW